MPGESLWIMCQPAAGFAGFALCNRPQRLIELGWAEDDPDADWDRPAGRHFPGETPDRVKRLVLDIGPERLEGVYVPRAFGPSYFLDLPDQARPETLGRAFGELFRASRILTATRGYVRGKTWALDLTELDDGDSGEIVSRVRPARRALRRGLDRVLPERDRAFDEPADGWNLELAGVEPERLDELMRRLIAAPDLAW